MPFSYLWHDYETWGADPAVDRPFQFAALRTDENLQPLGEPVKLWCRAPRDHLPHPEACLITGVNPLDLPESSLTDFALARHIHDLMAQPGTCSAGYNSIRFDDEVTRQLLFRNLHDPYAREWRYGNSRWDLIDVLRMAHALRPSGMAWAYDEKGHAVFKLEALSAVNGIHHDSAHDALADVLATLALARLLRQAQPKLYAYALGLRHKPQVARALNLTDPQLVVHVSSRFPARRGCLALVFPLAIDPGNPNGVISLDVSATDPGLLETLDVAAIRQRVFTARGQLPAEMDRIALKIIHLNRSPMLAPLSTLNPGQAERWGIDYAEALRRAEWLRAHRLKLVDVVEQVFLPESSGASKDVERSLYSGGFLPEGDRAQLAAWLPALPDALARPWPEFQDQRLPELCFRLLARNWPEQLTAEQRSRWQQLRRDRFLGRGEGMSLMDFWAAWRAALLRHEGDAQAGTILHGLADWVRELMQELELSESDAAATGERC